MLNLIPLLTGTGTVSFDLVIPSLPGFGFSAKPASPGINTTLIAGLWVKLMSRLGYLRFIAQGGDFGAMVSTHIALNHPDSLIGLHLNYIPFNYQPFLPADEKLTAEETAAQQKTYQFFQSEGAYASIQGTKPLTLAYGLNDSPVGLCAWILQLFKSFSNPALAPDELFNQDELLANVTLYWITQTIYSSMHLYRAGVEEPLRFGATDFIQVPVGIAHYPYPDSFPARKYVERGYHVRYWKDMPAGGHFAAMEQPALLQTT
jgi:pimeloyl-ACP methyl ester carboxylesterase